MTSTADHRNFCKEAADHYLAERNATSDAEDWKFARWEARRMMIDLLRESGGFCEVARR